MQSSHPGAPSDLGASDPSGRPASRLPGGVVIALGLAAGLLAAMIWAGGTVVSRYLMTASPLSAHDLALVRYAGALPIALVLVAMFPARLGNTMPSWRLLVLLLLAGPPYQALLIFGYGHATAGAGALMVSGLVPVFALVLAIGGGGTTAAGLSVGSIAAALLVLIGLSVHYSGLAPGLSVTGTGVAVFVAAALMWALLNHAISRWAIDPLRLTLALVVWSPLFLPLWWMTRPSFDFASMPLPDLALQIVMHGWLTGLVATGLFFFAVRALGAPVAAIQQATIPSFAAWFGDQALAEQVTPVQVAGLAITTAGMVLAIVSVAVRRRRVAGPVSGE